MVAESCYDPVPVPVPLTNGLFETPPVPAVPVPPAPPLQTLNPGSKFILPLAAVPTPAIPPLLGGTPNSDRTVGFVRSDGPFKLKFDRSVRFIGFMGFVGNGF